MRLCGMARRWVSVGARAAALTVIVAVAPCAVASASSLRGLGTFGGDYSIAWSINDQGQVAGSADLTDGDGRAFRWTRSGGMQDLGTLAGTTWSAAFAINRSGQVTGEAGGNGVEYAFRWTPSGGMQNLGAPPGGSDAQPYAINDLGQVVGAVTLADGATHAFRWTPKGGMQDLGTLGGDFSAAFAINDQGQIAGIASLANGDQHVFRWTPSGGMQDLGTLGGVNDGIGGALGVADAINNLGQVTGDAELPDGNYDAFRWTPAHGMEDLGTTPGATHTEGVAINDSGQVAGDYSNPQTGSLQAFRWTPGKGIQLLGTLPGGEYSYPYAINDRGQVCGESSTAPGDTAPGRCPLVCLWQDQGPRDIGGRAAAGSAR